jgi:putative ubiquitin-RnfH superfamily antitoxin RatB of RatAB toxin-antitoxin module
VKLTLVYSPQARRVHEWTVELADNATAQDGLARLQSLLSAHAPDDVLAHPEALTLAVWGRKASLHQALRDGDRLEWCRPLQVDPKLARRERFKQQGARTTGLFARRRAGAKPGY